jgi:hypothetical protein
MPPRKTSDNTPVSLIPMFTSLPTSG